MKAPFGRERTAGRLGAELLIGAADVVARFLEIDHAGELLGEKPGPNLSVAACSHLSAFAGPAL
jgi:hypothetical protein